MNFNTIIKSDVEPVSLTLKVVDGFIGSFYLTWDLSVGDAAQTFLLTISHGTSSDIISLNELYYHFIAPEGAPPCEIYNFSVTATYVGATYTGAGCSVPSPVISTMLPSLPFIGDLQSYYNFSIEKQAGEAVLTVYFQVILYLINLFPCEICVCTIVMIATPILHEKLNSYINVDMECTVFHRKHDIIHHC